MQTEQSVVFFGKVRLQIFLEKKNNVFQAKLAFKQHLGEAPKKC